jgi:hypothetical protein
MFSTDMVDFHWFQNSIIRDTFRRVHEKHGKTVHTAIPDDEDAQVWSDSDMTNIKVMTEFTRLIQNVENGMICVKCSAKATNNVQQILDMGDSFKIIHRESPAETASTCDEP